MATACTACNGTGMVKKRGFLGTSGENFCEFCSGTGFQVEKRSTIASSAADGPPVIGGMVNSPVQGETVNLGQVDLRQGGIAIEVGGGEVMWLLEQNLRPPITRSMIMSNQTRTQTEVEMRLLYGTSSRAKENRFIGRIRVPGLSRAPRQTWNIEVGFVITEKNELIFSARDAAFGTQLVTRWEPHTN